MRIRFVYEKLCINFNLNNVMDMVRHNKKFVQTGKWESSRNLTSIFFRYTTDIR
jgi:hypothetical protein